MTSLKKKRPLVIKLVYGDDIRRWRYNNRVDVPQYSEMVPFIRTTFKLDKFQLKYVDDEMDHLTITTQDDLQDAIDVATDEQRKSVKIFVTKPKPVLKKKKCKKKWQNKKVVSNNGGCVCGARLMLTSAKCLYGGRGVFCDGCDLQCSQHSHVYHCNSHSWKHPSGYDLCIGCFKRGKNKDVPLVYPMVGDNISPMEQARIDAMQRLDSHKFPASDERFHRSLDKVKLVQRLSAAAALLSESLSSNSNECFEVSADDQLQRAIDKAKKSQELVKPVVPEADRDEVDMELELEVEVEDQKGDASPEQEKEKEKGKEEENQEESKEEEQARLEAIERLASIYFDGDHQVLVDSLEKAKKAQKQSLVQNVMEARSQKVKAEAELAMAEKAEKKVVLKFKHQGELDLLVAMGYPDNERLRNLLVKYQGSLNEMFQEL